MNDQNEFNAQVELSIRFIIECTEPTKNVRIKSNMYMTSYSFKHRAENYFNTYICNDAFKEAARLLNIKSKKVHEVNEYYAFKMNFLIYDKSILNENRPKFKTALNRLKELNNSNPMNQFK